MSIKKKEIEDVLPLLYRYGDGVGKGAVRCINLRPGLRDGVVPGLVPAGAYGAVTSGGWHPVCGFAGGELLVKGLSVGVFDGVSVKTAGGVSTPVRCGRRSADGALLMTDDKVYSVDTVGLVRAHGAMACSITLSAESAGLLSCAVDSRVLSQEYASEGRLGMSDENAVSRDWQCAYGSICGDASSVGAFVAPVLARWRAVDASGVTVGVGPVVMLSAPGKSTDSGAVTLGGSDRRTLPGYEIVREAYRIRATVQNLDACVAAVVVEVSPQFHDWDVRCGCEARALHGNGGQNWRISWPVNRRGLSTHNLRGATMAASMAVARAEKLLRPCGTLSRGRVGTGSVGGGSADAVTDLAAIDSVLGQVVKDSGGLAAAVRYPHSFSARCVAEDGTTVAWGNIRTRRFGGYAVGDMCVATGGKSWRGWAQVTVDGTQTEVWSGEGSSGMPMALSSVVSYPDATASLLTVCVESGDGTVYQASVPLYADPSGTFAVGVSEDLRPIPLQVASGVTYSVPSARHYQGEWPRGIVICSAVGDGLSVLRAVECAGEVRSLCAVPRADQSWEYGRSRYAVGTSAGLYVLTTERGALSSTLRSRLSRAIASEYCMCAGGDRVFSLDCAGVVRGMDSRGKMSVLARFDGASGLVYNAVHNELEVYYPTGNTRNVLCLDCPGYGYERNDGFTVAGSCDGFVWDSAGTLYSTAVERAVRRAVLHSQYCRRAHRGGLRRVGWRVTSTSLTGRVTVESGAMGGATATVCKLEIAGRVVSPPVRSVMWHGSGMLLFAVDAVVEPDFLLEGYYVE